MKGETMTNMAGNWRTDDPPRDGTLIIAFFKESEYPWIVGWLPDPYSPYQTRIWMPPEICCRVPPFMWGGPIKWQPIAILGERKTKRVVMIDKCEKCRHCWCMSDQCVNPKMKVFREIDDPTTISDWCPEAVEMEVKE
jgi:hypothetical protein